MKKLVILTILVQCLTFSNLVNASGWQTECSSANGGILISEGHFDWKFNVKKHVSGNQYEIVDFNELRRNGEIQYNRKHLKTIETNEYDYDCTPGEYIWRGMDQTTVEKITITKSDETEFDGYYVGLEHDKKSISAYMICHTSRSSQYRCPTE